MRTIYLFIRKLEVMSISSESYEIYVAAIQRTKGRMKLKGSKHESSLKERNSLQYPVYWVVQQMLSTIGIQIWIKVRVLVFLGLLP